MKLLQLDSRKLFDNYEEWHMKSPDYNRNGFNIVGIDNTLKAMHDGYFMYVELYPPHAIDGCTAMKARVGENEGFRRYILRHRPWQDLSHG